jgi:hypothetical protein
LRTALAYYRLAKIEERLGDENAAQLSYQQAISRLEKLAIEWPEHVEYRNPLQDGRHRLQLLLAGHRR